MTGTNRVETDSETEQIPHEELKQRRAELLEGEDD